MSQMFLNVVSTFKGDGLAAATRQLGAFGQAAGGLGSTLGKVGAALASFGIITKATNFFGNAIDGARDLERNIFGVRKVFGAFAPEMEAFAKSANQIGLSQSEAAKASTFLGSVLKQSGFSMSDVTKETQKLVETGVDLATLYGYDVQEALLGMTALFRGEYDPIEKFGVAMKQSEVNSELAAKKLDHLQGSARRYQEQIIRLELFTTRAADSIGAFSEQSRNLFAAQKILTANFKDMQAAVGAELLPIMAELTNALLPLLQQLMPKLAGAFRDAIPGLQAFSGFLVDLSDESSTTNQTVSALFDTFGRIFRIVADNVGLILQLATVFLTARTAVALFAAALAITPFTGFIAGISAVAGGVLVAIDNFKKYRRQIERVGDAMTDAEKESAAFLITLTTFPPVLGPLQKLFQDLVKAVLIYTGALEGIPKNVETNVKINIPDMGEGGAYAAAADQFRQQKLFESLGLDEQNKGDDKGAATKKQPSIMETLKTEATKSKLATKLIGKGLMEGLAEQITDRGPKAARKQLKKIRDTAGAHATKLNEIYKKTAAGKAELDRIQAENDRKDAEQKAKDDKIADDLAEKERQRVEEQQRVYKSFADSVKGLFGGIRDAILGAFDITGLGGSTNSILRNMEKMLTRLRSFSASVKQLATMGLDPALLQQIIGMGPMAGATLASRLVQGGAGALASINAGYAEFGSLATDIATTGTNAMFGREQQKTIYNINVSGGVGSGATIGKAIVDAIKDYERTSGAVWQGA